MVAALTKQLKPGKAAGEDEIRGEVFKTIVDIVVPYLEHLFAACLRLSHHPEAFQDAINHPAPRSLARGKGNVPKDPRPISLLPILGKMLEKLVAMALRKLCEFYGLLPT